MSITVTHIEQTCCACPEQYEGILSDGRHFYVRCRWGYGELRVGDTLENAIGGETISEINYPDNFQGSFDEGDLKKLFSQAGINA